MDCDIDVLGLPKPKASAAWEARAQITWGETQAEVRSFLLEKGFDEAEADRLLAILIRERDTSIRRKGLLGTVLGGLLLFVTTPALIYFRDGINWLLQYISIPAALASFVLCVLIAGTLAGAVLFFTGLERLVRGARMKGTDSDIQA